MSKSTKKTLIIAGIITLVYVLVFFYICKAEPCGRWQKRVNNNIEIGDMVESNNCYHYLNPKEPKHIGRVVESLGYPSTDGYERVKLNDRTEWTTKFLHKTQDGKKLGNVIESKITVDKPCECIKRIEELERKVDALNNMLSEAGIGTLVPSKSGNHIPLKSVISQPKISGSIDIKNLKCIHCGIVGKLHMVYTNFYCSYCGKASYFNEYFKE